MATTAQKKLWASEDEGWRARIGGTRDSAPLGSDDDGNDPTSGIGNPETYVDDDNEDSKETSETAEEKESGKGPGNASSECGGGGKVDTPQTSPEATAKENEESHDDSRFGDNYANNDGEDDDDGGDTMPVSKGAEIPDERRTILDLGRQSRISSSTYEQHGSIVDKIRQVQGNHSRDWISAQLSSVNKIYFSLFFKII